MKAEDPGIYWPADRWCPPEASLTTRPERTNLRGMEVGEGPSPPPWPAGTTPDTHSSQPSPTSKIIMILSDMHCGHQYGLTPPAYQINPKTEEPRLREISLLERAAWNEYIRMANAHPRPDILVVLGDAIDGKGKLSGGTELLTSDRRLQCQMAAECIYLWKPKQILLLYGTAYHTGEDEDWEAVLADKLVALGMPASKIEIHSRAWVEAYGRKIHFRHHVSRSVIPYGRHTAPMRGLIWLKLWSKDYNWPDTDILWYGHVHYYTRSEQRKGCVVTSPSLQLYTKYGARQVDGTFDWGIAYAQIYEDGKYEIFADIVDFTFGIPHTVKI